MIDTGQVEVEITVVVHISPRRITVGFLIFDSKRPGAVGGEGDIDLYICFRNKKRMWGDAISMGDKINSPLQDHVASLSSDGKYLFFAHGEQDCWDIYWVDAKVIDELKPEHLR